MGEIHSTDHEFHIVLIEPSDIVFTVARPVEETRTAVRGGRDEIRPRAIHVAIKRIRRPRAAVIVRVAVRAGIPGVGNRHMAKEKNGSA